MAKGLKGWGAAKGGIDKSGMTNGRAVSGGNIQNLSKGGKVEGACMSEGGVVKPAGLPKQK